MQSLITAGIAVLLAVTGGIILQHTALRELFYIRCGLEEGGCCAVLILLYLLISLIMPYLMIHKNSVREILKTN